MENGEARYRMMNERKQATSRWRSKLSNAVRRTRRGAQRYAQPVLSGFLALTMVSGSVPAPAYAQMMEDATRSLALAAQEMEQSEQSISTASLGEADDEQAAADEQAIVSAQDDAAASASEQGGATSDQAAGDTAQNQNTNTVTASGDAAGAASTGDAQSASAGSVAADTQQEEVPAALFSTNDDLSVVTVSGDALASRSAAVNALKDAGADDASAREMSDALFSAANNGGSNPLKKEGSSLPTEADGTSIEQVTATWMTEDSKNNNDDDLLYFKPASADDQSVSMRVNYALAGAVDYPAGSIVITVPAYIFVNRSGGAMGSMRLSVPEDPSTRMEWNYKLIGDTCQIANTRKLPAAVAGYMEFAIEGVRPFELVDMKTSLPFNASVEVTTNAGTLIGKKSNELTAQFDTEAKISTATKKSNEEPRIVDSSYIPEEQRVPGETRYLVTTWYMNGLVSGATTQKYTLSFEDEKNDEYKGFVIGQTDGDRKGSSEGVKSKFAGNLNNGEPMTTVGKTEFTVVEVAYPFSQFEKNKVYTLKNKVTYTLTELDPQVDLAGGSQDKKLVTTAASEASVEWSYADPTFDHPVGDVSLYVYGTTPSYGSGMTTTSPSGVVVDSDLTSVGDPGKSPFNGYYGSYSKGLNDIQDDANPVVSYTLNTIGYIMPFTYKKVVDPVNGGDPQGMPENYGHVPIMLTTEDLGLSLNDTGAGAVYDRNLKAGEDFTYTAVEFPERPHSMKGVFVNLDENGNSTAQPGEKTGIEYEVDSDVSVTPDVILQVKRNGSWGDYAVASWHETGELKLTVNGALQNPGVSRVYLPADTQSVRTVVTTSNAAILYHVRVYTALHNAGTLGKQVAKAFEGSTTPKLSVWNYAALDAKSADGSVGMKDVYRKRAHNVLQGYSTDMSDRLSASARSNEGSDVDYTKRQVTVHYSAKMNYQSHIASKVTFEEAMEDGRLLPQEGATWYSLLPKGFAPQMDSIKLRRGDTVREMYTVENFRGTGRTLPVVPADLTPQASTYKKDGVYLYEDVPSISFSAVTGFETVEDYGTDTHNAIVYQSDNDTLGSVEGYLGEPDDPSFGNNVGTKDAFASDAELKALTDLDVTANNPVFLYAGVTQQLPDTLKSGNTGLSKMAMVNGDGSWANGQGQGYMSRVAYTGGDYSYRIAAQSGENNATSQVVLYDSLENYDGADGAAWKGSFVRVDVSSLEKAGCEPKVYYSTQENLAFEEQTSGGSESVKPVETNLDLENGGIWQPLTDKVDPTTVKAIAIDASKKADGSDFVLESGERASATIHMRAPKQVPTADAHAYNVMYLSAVAGEPNSGADPEVSRSDYTMVGLKDYTLSVENTWEDEYDRDGKRPTELVLHLYANGKPADEAGFVEPGKATITLTEAGGWKGSFGTLPSHADDGSKIIYSIKEDVPEGHAAEIRLVGETALIKNTHEPERITIKGTKTWSGDSPDVRPSSIKVDLYRNGERVGSRTVRPNSIGLWSYEFRDLYKYDGGKQVDFSIKEDMSAYPSYASTVSGYDIHNEYHPYGDLVVSKEVRNTSDASRDKAFTFAFEFGRKVQDAEDVEPVFTEYDYTVYQGDTEVSKGAIATNGTIELKGGQRAVVHSIDQDVSYSVTEREVAGFTADEATKSGTIVPNQTAEAAFVNTYEATSVVNFKARKGLGGHLLQKGLFNFELVDANTNKVIRTAQNQAADFTDESNGFIVESAPVVFGATTYTQADHGKTFEYLIREMNTGLKGYTYSDAEYKVSVSVVDNGDGTLETTVAYATADGTAIEDPLSFENGVLFLNSYIATAELNVQAMKKLTGGTLQEGQFQFNIGTLRFDDKGKLVFGEPTFATNAADGTISFKPVVFTQDDAGKTAYIVASETHGTDPAVEYDDHLALMKVDVKDNGDGTLSLSTKTDGFDVPCWNHVGEACTICGGDELVTPQKDAFVFQNAYKDGSLTIEKTVPEGKGDSANPDQLFDFRVELTNEEGQPVEVKTEDIAIGKIGEQTSEPVVAVSDAEDEASAESTPLAWLLDRGREAWNAFTGFFKPEQAYAATANSLPAHGANDGWSWSIDADGNLTVTGSKISGGDSTLKSYAAEVKTAKFATGSRAVSLNEFFLNFKNMISVDFNGLDVTSVSNVDSMFRGCTALETLDLSGVQLRVTYAGRMFEGCSSLRSLQGLDIAAESTGSAIDVSSMFSGCSSLTELDLLKVNISGASSMNSMFNGCSSLTALDVSGLDTSSVSSMDDTFEGCTSLQELDLSDWDCSKVTTMYRLLYQCKGLKNVKLPTGTSWVLKNTGAMFTGCTALTSVDLSQIGLSLVTYMGNMFDGCSSLTSVKFPISNKSAVTNMDSMFSGCTSLQSVDFSQFDLSNLTSLESAFYRCINLEYVKLPRVDKGSLTNLYRTFDQCTSLQKLDFRNFDLSKVKYLSNAFTDCSSLTSVVFPAANQTALRSMAYSFNGCTNLQTVDFSQFDLSSVENMERTFYHCSSLVNVSMPKVESSSLASLYQAFCGCTSLATLDLSQFDLSKLVNAREMLNGCKGLTSVKFPSTPITQLSSAESMLSGCSSLAEVDLSSFVPKVDTNLWDFSMVARRCERSCLAIGSCSGGLSSLTAP